jgi:flagellar biosynthesis activator protein FlaF
MSAHVKGYSSYAAHQRNDETVRETEAHALLSCANRLEAACRPECSPEDFVEAVRLNQQLWTLFQVTLCEPDNMLPRDLKMLLLSISRYVDKTSFSAIGDSNPSLLKGLISINRNIATGLSQKPKESKAADVSTPPVSAPPESVMTTA